MNFSCFLWEFDQILLELVVSILNPNYSLCQDFPISLVQSGAALTGELLANWCTTLISMLISSVNCQQTGMLISSVNCQQTGMLISLLNCQQTGMLISFVNCQQTGALLSQVERAWSQRGGTSVGSAQLNEHGLNSVERVWVRLN